MVGQPAPNLKLCFVGLNPAHQIFWVCLDAFLNCNFCENLGHENPSKYLSRNSPKVEVKDRPMLLLSSSSRRVIPFTQFQALVGYYLFSWSATCVTC